MKIVPLRKVPKLKVQVDDARNTWKQLPIGRADSSPSFSFRVFTVKPDGHTPYHAHPFEHLNYVIAGRGALVQGSGRKRPIREGDFALVLPNEKHQYRNTSRTKSLVLICAVPNQYE